MNSLPVGTRLQYLLADVVSSAWYGGDEDVSAHDPPPKPWGTVQTALVRSQPWTNRRSANWSMRVLMSSNSPLQLSQPQSP